jgi:hypothetical protein
VSARPRPGGARRAHLGRPLAGALVTLLLVALVPLVAAATGCGSAAESTEVAAYLGSWQRVEGGAADAQRTLLVERQDDVVRAEFSDLTTGFDAGGVATLEDGYLALDLPAGNGLLDAPGLQISLDANGQLIVDRVLDDGTTEPVWVYERAPSPGATTEP